MYMTDSKEPLMWDAEVRRFGVSPGGFPIAPFLSFGMVICILFCAKQMKP